MSQVKSILIIDDEPDLREILAEEFRFEGFDVFEAQNGVEALAIFLEKRPSAIVSDIRMSGGDGVTLAKSVRALEPVAPPIFLITGFADLTAEAAFNFGVEGLFHKPFQIDEIKAAIMASLQKPESRLQQTLSTKPTIEIELQGEGFKDFYQEGSIKLGRGGLSAPLDCLVGVTRPLLVGEIVAVKSIQAKLFEGIVRWVRHQSNEYPPAVGIEIKKAENDFLDQFLRQENLQKAACFIPAQQPL